MKNSVLASKFQDLTKYLHRRKWERQVLT